VWLTCPTLFLFIIPVGAAAKKYFMILKISTITIVLLTLISCQKITTPDPGSGGGSGGAGTVACKIDKIQSYGISSATQPDNFYFIYDANNKLIQINSISNGTNVLRGVFTYSGSNVTKIETLSLSNTGNLTSSGYFDISYSSNIISNIKHYIKPGSSFVLDAAIEYSYNASGQRIQKRISQNNGSATLILEYTYNYFYDNLGNIVKIEGKDKLNQPFELINYEYNNKENDLKSNHAQFDAFAWLFLDGFEPFIEGGETDARYLSKYQMVKQIYSNSSGVKTFNFSYSYHANGKVSQMISNKAIYRSDIAYLCK
jgi:hypothetical protein